MGLDDKIQNEAQDISGKTKESVGEATGNRDMQAEGKGDQLSAGVKKAGENIKDAAKNVTDAFKN